MSGQEKQRRVPLMRALFDRRFSTGRVLKLRLILATLVVGSAVYLVYNVYRLTLDFQTTGSLTALISYEWGDGTIVTKTLKAGIFQLFVLILGWSMFFRLRVGELANLRLRRSENKYRSIINHAGEAIFLLNHRGRVLEWNKMSEELFGLYRRHALGVNIRELDIGLDLPVLQVFADVERAKRSLTYDAKVVHKKRANETRLLSLTFSCIEAGSGALADTDNSFAVIARDVTHEKQIENRMSETEKLAGIGQLAAGIAHQLNTPLGAILLSAQMLEETVKNEDDGEDIMRIIRQTEQCRGIIKGLLNFARPTGSERGKVDLAEIIKDTIFLMEKKVSVAAVKVEFESIARATVYGSRNELEQVFFNLLANALDAMAKGGKIKIRVEDGGAGELKIQFTDNGDGIPADAQSRIFLPFFTTKDYGKGTGLGLSIVARIVHEHGGRIELDSKVGEGTTFTLWFPQAREDSHNQVGRLALIDDGDGREL